MATKAKFGSRIGLIAATVGSAVGLGNVWRFPAETQANGGAAFLIVYIGCILLLGIPVMLAEFSLGRRGDSDVIGVFTKLRPGTRWWVAGAIALLASYLILCFYMVVAAWTLEYLRLSATGELFADIPASGSADAFNARMEEFIGGTWRPVAATCAMVALNLAILLKGVRKGIERMSNILMPVLFALLLVFAAVALTLPRAAEGLSFFLRPDFSLITPHVVINALGQAFFSLSLGMGILITYAAYYPRETRLTRTAFTVSALDLLVALLMGFIIFPAVTSFGLGGEGLEGTTLVFVTLPEVFLRMPGSAVWSALFFLLLLVAALTSTLSVAEVSVAFLQDRFGMSRVKGCLTVLMPLFILSSLCALSFGPLRSFTPLGMNLFNLLDTFATNICLPMAAMLTCLFLGWRAPKGLLRAELTNDGTLRGRLYPAISFIIRYVAPFLILIIWLSSFIDF